MPHAGVRQKVRFPKIHSRKDILVARGKPPPSNNTTVKVVYLGYELTGLEAVHYRVEAISQ